MKWHIHPLNNSYFQWKYIGRLAEKFRLRKIHMLMYLLFTKHRENVRELQGVLCWKINFVLLHFKSALASPWTFQSTNIYIYIYIYISYSGNQDSILRRVIPNTEKLVLDVSLLNTQCYKVQIKGKWIIQGKE